MHVHHRQTTNTYSRFDDNPAVFMRLHRYCSFLLSAFFLLHALSLEMLWNASACIYTPTLVYSVACYCLFFQVFHPHQFPLLTSSEIWWRYCASACYARSYVKKGEREKWMVGRPRGKQQRTHRKGKKTWEKEEHNKNIDLIPFFSFLLRTRELRGLIFRVMFDRDRFFIILKKKKYK